VARARLTHIAKLVCDKCFDKTNAPILACCHDCLAVCEDSLNVASIMIHPWPLYYHRALSIDSDNILCCSDIGFELKKRIRE
jgi:hypothetical protein